jgi:hypothetical protein
MNNFDASTSGVNLELNVSYDSDLSQMWFDESLTNIYRGGISLLNENYHGIDVWTYTNYRNLSCDFNLDDLENYNIKSVANKQLLNYLRVTYYESSDGLKEDTLHYFNKYPYQLNKGELLELAENILDSEDYINFLIENCKPLYVVVSSRGYSQGDYVEVVIPFAYWEGKAPTGDQLQSMQTEIDNLFWNAPIRARLTIDNDSEFMFDEFMKDVYNYDQSELLKIAVDYITHDNKQMIIDWLQVNLPDHPSYDN